MPASPRETVLCRYRYDPLDRLVDCAPSAEAGIQRFYCKSRLATEIQGAVQRSVFQHDDQLLAQHRREDAKVKTALLATDQQRSVLNVLDANRVHPLAYSPYGHRPAESGLLSLLGFNGERPDPVTGHYLLGNGYRAFNPVLMRFNSPDSLSPFGEGGVNAYGYCEGDPINRSDPTGHFGAGLKAFLRGIGVMKPKVDVYNLGYKVTAGYPIISKGKNINPITARFRTTDIPLGDLNKKQIYRLAKEVEHDTKRAFAIYSSIYDSMSNGVPTPPPLYFRWNTHTVNLTAPPKSRTFAKYNLVEGLTINKEIREMLFQLRAS
ncbi:RHS repeat-associated core domain-containing protein [Pseudomonas sp. CFII68]|uniref:RHS repeat-associated core domain-containing protein n=1 Tax=Pseudomonas sp. CFII68 TaxID=911243 RepID=UPI0003550005|nr:RHS repeat-associated core domain-containing protein [Pseudomonas sp. CFII68]EPJ96136.1 hypothetical protein CFII68_05724 [Pseudomonas sp. CFII68]